MFYGGVMGVYGGVDGPRLWQVFYSALKVPFLLFTTFFLSLPSFCLIINYASSAFEPIFRAFFAPCSRRRPG